LQYVAGAILGAVLAGIQSDWDLGSVMAGAFIGGISTGVFSSVSGATAGALEGVISQAAIKGAIAGATGGLVAGGTAGLLSAQISGGDPLDALLHGAFAGILSGGAFGAIQGHYGTKWSMQRVALHTLAGGAVSAISGGNALDGAAWSGGIALLAHSATAMRAKMIAQSKLDSRNSSGISAGHKGDGFKLAGGRFNLASPAAREIFGGAQGGPGRFLNRDYFPNSWQDSVCEAYAGPHDFLNSVYMYDAIGNIRAMNSLESNLGSILAFMNLFNATPFVLADSLQPAIFNLIHQ